MIEQYQIAAEVLWNANVFKTPCDPVRTIIGESDVDSAYKVQEINIQKRIASGEQVIGKKIGLTSFAVQKQLGVDQPDYGILFDTMKIGNGASLSKTELMQPKAEAEIAFVMKSDLSGKINMDTLIAAIDFAVPAIEIVGSRVENWNIKITDTIADNASASHFVLGENKVNLSDIDLTGCVMKMTKNGEVMSEGTGAACMDNPLNAALWLATVMANNGQPLKAGEILLSGALGPMVNITAGDFIEANIEGLGVVSLKIV
ncbi:MAG: 2-keto-4-pentenoate hydratase [Bacteroidia bacterium]|jgi:2-keto-4-pentenoate hydratase